MPATSSGWRIADTINALYKDLNIRSALTSVRGTARTVEIGSTNIGTLIEMVSMTNGGKTANVMKRDEDELAARATYKRSVANSLAGSRLIENP